MDLLQSTHDQQPCKSPEQSLPDICIFSVRPIVPFLCVPPSDSTAALGLGAVLNHKVTNKKLKNTKGIAIKRPQKGHLFTI